MTVEQQTLPNDENQREVGKPQKGESSSKEEQPKVAIFVAHGMGQQIPFETLDYTAQALIKACNEERNKEPKHSSPIVARTVLLGEKKVQRLEFTMPDANGGLIEVHAYEGYWAPITEGKVTLWDILSFFVYAGRYGIGKEWNILRERRDRSAHGKASSTGDGGATNIFRRWIFGKYVNFQIPFKDRSNLFTAFFTLLSFTVIALLLTLVASTQFLSVNRENTWPSIQLLKTITMIVGFYVGFTLVFAVWLGATYYFRKAIRQRWPSFWKPLNKFLWRFFQVYLGITIAIGVILLYFTIKDFFFRPAESGEELTRSWQLTVWGVWGLLLLLSVIIRSFVIQYLGDVVAYISAFRLDRFMDIRTKIRQWVSESLLAIYKYQEGDEHIYDRIGIIGHSLGAVIVYDALNTLLNDDELNGRMMKVAERTKVLLTFGCPLDKIAYVLGLAGSNITESREALATSVQPLIQDYGRYRQLKWINVFAKHDIIGGDVDFFDDNDEENEERRVVNLEDEKANIPLMAHSELWETGFAFGLFYDKFVGKPKVTRTA